MTKKKGPRPIIELHQIKVRVGWKHPACAWCGKPFQTKRKDAKTCSDRCRTRRSLAARAAAA